MNTTTRAAVAVALLALLGCQAAAAAEHNVKVLFLAKYEAIEQDIEDFTKQFNVMMFRTGAVDSGDVLSVQIDASEHGYIVTTVSVASESAAYKLTDAVLGRHLSVYIGKVGYIGVIPGEALPKVTTPVPDTTPGAAPKQPETRAPTQAPTQTPPTTEHPSVNGYVWLSEYTADNEDIGECSTGHAWSGMVLSRMPVGCHRFQHAMTQQDEYNFLGLSDGKASKFGMICDPSCSSCISQEVDLEYSSCVGTWGGSITVYPAGDVCIGASYVELSEGGLSISRFSEPGCDIAADPKSTLYLRNYPAPDTTADATCRADGSRGKYYALSRIADENGAVFYNGKLDCTDSDCTEGCTEVDSWQEGSCHSDDSTGHGVRIELSLDALSICSSDASGAKSDPIISAQSLDISEPAEEQELPASSPSDGAPNATSPAPYANATARRAPESTPGSTVAALDQRTGADVDVVQQSTTTDGMGAPENKRITAVMIAAGCVVGIAFVTIGLIHKRKQALVAQVETDEDDEDFYAEYDYNSYNQYDRFDDYHDDDRLIQEI